MPPAGTENIAIIAPVWRASKQGTAWLPRRSLLEFPASDGKFTRNRDAVSALWTPPAPLCSKTGVKRRWILLFITVVFLIGTLATGWNFVLVRDYQRILELARGLSRNEQEQAPWFILI